MRKLTRVVDGHRRFLDQPPLLTRIPLAGSTAEIVEATFAAYRASLNDSRRRPLEGIGPEDVLVLQLKEAQRSVIERSDTVTGSPDPATFTAAGLLAYARLTGTTLARAHARSGDPVPIAAYLGLGGKADRADGAFADFAGAYAEQATADSAGFVSAIRSGRLVSA